MTRTASELAEYVGGRLEGDPRLRISGIASPERATAEDLIYQDSLRHVARSAESAALCVLVAEGVEVAGKTTIGTPNPKFAFAKAAQWLLATEEHAVSIHPSAIIAATARLAPDVSIGPYVVIEDGVEVQAGTLIEAYCFLGRGSRVGENCRLHPRVTLYAGARLGNRVELHSGAVIGGDGFGYVYGEGKHWKFPQVGTIELGDDVEVGCNTTIDRGSLGATKIHSGVKIDNLVQIAHNVEIGENSLLAAQVGISGSSTIGKQVLVGGQVGMSEHCTVEDGAIVGAQAGILPGKIIRAGQVVWGTPARPLEKFKEQFAWLGRLPELAERVRRLSLADKP
jgi:UDP-3-O-[3-hydroxymyristoyl] glucosamine N-acyltransferase